MQKIQMFHFALVKVRGPMGIHREERMSVCDTSTLNHSGKTYAVGTDGWVEVPTDVYESIKDRHFPHVSGNGYMKWCTPSEVDETSRLGLVDKVPEPEPRPARKVAKPAA